MFHILNGFILNLFNILNIYQKSHTRNGVAEIFSVTESFQ